MSDMQHGWGAYSNASRFREWLKAFVIRVVDRERPGPRFGVVESVDDANDVVYVVYVNEETSVPVKMWGVRPTTPGQKVMVDGPSNFRYITQVR